MSGNNQKNMLNGGMSLFAGLSADDLTRTSPNSVEDAFSGYTLTSQNPSCNGLYTIGYHFILECNDVMEKLPVAAALSDSARNELLGEAFFVRGLVYFYLVNLFGDLPLVTSTNYEVNNLKPRLPAEIIYLQIIFDLQHAEQLLPDMYITHGTTDGERVRPNKATARALLARVYLYQQQWELAAQEASAVISDPAYHLETDLDKVFQSSSNEAIWELQPVYGNTCTVEASLFIPSGAAVRPTYVLTSWLQNSFEPGDRRLSNWTGVYSDTTSLLYPSKYKAVNTSSSRVEYNTVFRLAEQYLIRAEARAHMGDTTGAAADVNMIRQRAGLSGIGPTDGAHLLTIIGHERQVEFFAEWGQRWLDLKRTGQAGTILRSEKPGWDPRAELYPIPYADLLHDPNLMQNAGY
ncbi:MAG TPA: RagB/SusD family nutrient uptake outer membrane protein [Puia sp.]|nr:RagB/SusD family nutrient uptake outer membrane protein [Puia sp.]